MFDAVDNLTFFIAENDIAVFSHDFYNQLFAAEVPHLVEMFDGEADNPFQSRLGDIHNPAAADVLAQKHAEVGCCHRACLVALCEVDKGERGAGRKIEALCSRLGFDSQKQFVRFRLRDFRDSSI